MSERVVSEVKPEQWVRYRGKECRVQSVTRVKCSGIAVRVNGVDVTLAEDIDRLVLRLWADVGDVEDVPFDPNALIEVAEPYQHNPLRSHGADGWTTAGNSEGI